MRLIDADETRKKMQNSLDELFENVEMTGKTIHQKTLIRSIIHHIDDAQTIDAAPVKRARWIKGKDWDDWFCSGCSNKAYLDWRENPILSSFCPHCGAEMDFCKAKEEENTRLEESFKKATVSREQFNKAANEIGDSDEWTDCDKMAIAVFVNELEEKLFGGADDEKV